MHKPRDTAPTGMWHKIGRFLEEPITEEVSPRAIVRRLRLAGQFTFLVIRGFVENRCPVRAAALSYTTLLALIPLLAVVVSVSKNLLANATAELVPKFLHNVIGQIVPQLEDLSAEEQQETVEKIQTFIGNIQTGTLGTVGTILLVFVAIRLLMTIESTFNDIWGVQEGRSIWRKVVYYWTTITLGPLLLLTAMYLTGRVEFAQAIGKLGSFASGSREFFLHLLPFVVMWFAFTLMYALMPNTRVRLRAAFIGGLVAGTLWQVNSMLNALYISRVVTYSKIYGALGIIPLFLVGLYFSWLIVLFGAQVSFAAQNIRTYLQQQASERIDQLGRELLACRMVLLACQNFLRGDPPPRVEEAAEKMRAPLQLLNQLVHRLVEGGVLRAVAGEQGGLQPARPPDSITIADVLYVVRTHHGVHGEIPRIQRSEMVERLLQDVYAAERSTPANARFSDLVDKDKPTAE